MILPGKTVFVVGAGGSVPHGFPTGQQLLDEFVTKWEPDRTRNKQLTILDRLELQEYERPLRELARLAHRMAASSIDECVRYHHDCAEAAKVAIALMLLGREPYTVQSNFKRVDGDWCGYLVRELLREPSLGA